MPDKQLALRGRTADRGPPGSVQVHTVGQIGPKRKRLANGSLLCEAVPVARTGWMTYRPGETPIKTRDGHPVAYVERDAQALFAPEAMGSLVAAVVTDEHPAADVTPDNASYLGKGFCLNAYRGEGDEADLLLADLVITDKHMIERIEAGKREISLGYEADYFQTGEGTGRQSNIIINHIALVERGRCGPRCAIGDSADSDPETPNHGEDDMGHRTRDNAAQPRRRVKLEALRDQINEAIEAEDEDQDGVHVHVHTNDAEGGTRTLDAESEGRLAAVEESVQSIASTVGDLANTIKELVEKGVTTTAKTGDSDPGTGEGDSKALERSFQEFVSQAEVLVPGYRAPTFDSALPRAKTVDTMCGARRQVLTIVASTADGKALLDSVAGAELDIEKGDCASIAVAFRAASALKGQQNNRAAVGDSRSVPVVSNLTSAPKPALTAEQMNEANKKFWESRKA